MLSRDLRDRAIADQDELVLKPSGSYGGVGVVVGPEVSAQTWREALDTALVEGGYILQRYGEVHEDAVPFCIAPYLFGGTPAGAYVRFAVPGAGPVVNVAQGALTSGLLLTP